MDDRVESSTEAMAANMAMEARAGKGKADGEDLPLVTFALFAYNQEKYIREAVEAALAQDYPNLEIIFSDDCSPDSTFDVMRESTKNYSGCHQVKLNRNPVNLGLGSHVNRVVAQSKGELIVLAAGDDISAINRVSRLVEKWRSLPGCVAVCSDSLVISGTGEEQEVMVGAPFRGALDKGVECYFSGVQGCAYAWTKQIFEVFGEMLQNTICEDRVVPLRAALLGNTGYVAEPLVKYRVHGSNISHFFATDPTKVMEKTISIHARNLVIQQNYVRDLQKAIALGMEPEAEISLALRAATNQASLLAAKIQFLQHGLIRKLQLIAWSATRHPKQCLRWIAIVVAPHAYLRNQMKNLGVD